MFKIALHKYATPVVCLCPSLRRKQCCVFFCCASGPVGVVELDTCPCNDRLLVCFFHFLEIFLLLKGTTSCELLLLASLTQSIKHIYGNCTPGPSVAISNPISHTGFGIQLYGMRLSFTGCSVPVSAVLPLAHQGLHCPSPSESGCVWAPRWDQCCGHLSESPCR